MDIGSQITAKKKANMESYKKKRELFAHELCLLIRIFKFTEFFKKFLVTRN